MTLERCFNEEYRLTSIDSIRLCTRSLFRWFISWYFEPFVTVFYKKCTALKIPSGSISFFSSAFGVPSISSSSFECVKTLNEGGGGRNRSFARLFYFRNMIVTFFLVRTVFIRENRYMSIFRYLRIWIFLFFLFFFLFSFLNHSKIKYDGRSSVFLFKYA